MNLPQKIQTLRLATVFDKKTRNYAKEKLKKDSIVLGNHYSGGNSTRFGIFSLLYGLNSTYWFTFLNASKGSVFFDVLKQLQYDMSIVSSTNTSWPEFKKTAYFNIVDKIKDDFKGKPWEKDKQSSVLHVIFNININFLLNQLTS